MLYALMNIPVFRLQFALEHPLLTFTGMAGVIAVYAAVYPRTR